MHCLEWQDWAHPILAERFKVIDGHIHIRDVPGNGLEWDEEAVARYRYEGLTAELGRQESRTAALESSPRKGSRCEWDLTELHGGAHQRL